MKSGPDYPKTKAYAANMSDADVRKLATEVLLARKGEASGYAAILISHCQTDADLPSPIGSILLAIHEQLNPPAAVAVPAPQLADPIADAQAQD